MTRGKKGATAQGRNGATAKRVKGRRGEVDCFPSPLHPAPCLYINFSRFWRLNNATNIKTREAEISMM